MLEEVRERRRAVTFPQRLQSRYADIERKRFARRVVFISAATVVLFIIFVVAYASRYARKIRWDSEQRDIASRAKHLMQKNAQAFASKVEAQSSWEIDPDTGHRIARAIELPESNNEPPLLYHDDLGHRDRVRLREALKQGSGLEKAPDPSDVLRKVLGDIDADVYSAESVERLTAIANNLMTSMLKENLMPGPDMRKNTANAAVVLHLILHRKNAVIRATYDEYLKTNQEKSPEFENFQREWRRTRVFDQELYLRLAICYDHLCHYLSDIEDRKNLFRIATKMFERAFHDPELHNWGPVRLYLAAWTRFMREQGENFDFPNAIDNWYPNFLEAQRSLETQRRKQNSDH